MRADRAQASASRVTGHASASMMRVGMGVLPNVMSIRMKVLLASAHRFEVRVSSVEAASSTMRNHPLCFDSAVGPFGAQLLYRSHNCVRTLWHYCSIWSCVCGSGWFW